MLPRLNWGWRQFWQHVLPLSCHSVRLKMNAVAIFSTCRHLHVSIQSPDLVDSLFMLFYNCWHFLLRNYIKKCQVSFSFFSFIESPTVNTASKNRLAGSMSQPKLKTRARQYNSLRLSPAKISYTLWMNWFYSSLFFRNGLLLANKHRTNRERSKGHSVDILSTSL